jgi:hypothetical protein
MNGKAGATAPAFRLPSQGGTAPAGRNPLVASGIPLPL